MGDDVALVFAGGDPPPTAVAARLNAFHGGEEMFVPYTEASLAARLARAPDLYGWERVWLAEGAVIGVWPAGRHLPGTAATAMARPLERILQEKAPSRQPLTWEQRQALLPYFDTDVRLLEKVTESDFSDWLQPRERSGGLVGDRPVGQRQARNGQPRTD